jgi:hypothetical protein
MQNLAGILVCRLCGIGGNSGNEAQLFTVKSANGYICISNIYR